MMNNKQPPKIDIAKFAQDGAHISGQLSLKDMPRLAESCMLPPDGITLETPIAQWAVRGEMRPNDFGVLRPWLILNIKSQIPVRCERCLQTVLLPVDEEFAYRFAKTEAQAAQEDEECEEVVLVLSQEFDLLELCEDELIMSIPYMPLHEQCDAPLIEGLDKAGITLQVVDESVDTNEKENPFAVLEQLKKKLH